MDLNSLPLRPAGGASLVPGNRLSPDQEIPRWRVWVAVGRGSSSDVRGTARSARQIKVIQWNCSGIRSSLPSLQAREYPLDAKYFIKEW